MSPTVSSLNLPPVGGPAEPSEHLFHHAGRYSYTCHSGLGGADSVLLGVDLHWPFPRLQNQWLGTSLTVITQQLTRPILHCIFIKSLVQNFLFLCTATLHPGKNLELSATPPNIALTCPPPPRLYGPLGPPFLVDLSLFLISSSASFPLRPFIPLMCSPESTFW